MTGSTTVVNHVVYWINGIAGAYMATRTIECHRNLGAVIDQLMDIGSKDTVTIVTTIRAGFPRGRTSQGTGCPVTSSAIIMHLVVKWSNSVSGCGVTSRAINGH